MVHEALDAGITFFDTADIYGGTKSEEFLGRALGRRRDEIVLATKFGMQVDDDRNGAKPDYVHRALEDSLRRLQTDHVDLYQLHAPDPDTPIAETLGALDECVRAGKVARDRLLELHGGAAARGRGGGAGGRGPLRQRAERVQPVAPRTPSATSCPSASGPASPSCPTSRWRRACSPASTGAASHLPPGTRLSGVKQNEGPLSDDLLAVVERLTEFAAAPEPDHGGARHRLDRWRTVPWPRSSPGPPRPSRSAPMSPPRTGSSTTTTWPRSTRWPGDVAPAGDERSGTAASLGGRRPGGRSSQTGRGDDASAAHGLDEQGVVVLGLVGVGRRRSG